MRTAQTRKGKSSWTEKLEAEAAPKKVKASGRFAEKFGKGEMIIATPQLVNALIRKIPKGRLATINILRQELARAFDADYACPITTGIFAWIASNAAEEARAAGAKRVVPWWRLVKDDGSLNPNAPGGEEYQAKLLRADGYSIVKKSLRSNKLVVKNAAALFLGHF